MEATVALVAILTGVFLGVFPAVVRIVAANWVAWRKGEAQRPPVMFRGGPPAA